MDCCRATAHPVRSDAVASPASVGSHRLPADQFAYHEASPGLCCESWLLPLALRKLSLPLSLLACSSGAWNCTGSMSRVLPAWQRVIFSAESSFCLGGDDQQICVWRHRGHCQCDRFVDMHHMSRRPGVTPPPPLPHPLQELCENSQAAWDGLSQDTIRNLYDSMLRRLANPLFLKELR